MDSGNHSELNETIHMLARSHDALEKTVRQLLSTYTGGSRHEALSSLLHRQLAAGNIEAAQLGPTLGLILREFDRYGAMLNNLLGAMNQAEALVARRTPDDVGQILREVVDIFEGAASERGIEIRLKVKGTPVLPVDRGLIYRAFMNVIDNAVKYSFSPSVGADARHVDINCRRHTAEGGWLITIQSYGVGILAEEIANGLIFEYGHRGFLARDRARGGTGIGLAEARRIILAHAGRIAIQSRAFGGGAFLTTVNIELPAA